jgi:hypothetical protein
VQFLTYKCTLNSYVRIRHVAYKTGERSWQAGQISIVVSHKSARGSQKHTHPSVAAGTSLLEMAQVWERLAQEETDRTPPVLGSIEPERPAMQQQQQVQPRVRKEEC